MARCSTTAPAEFSIETSMNLLSPAKLSISPSGNWVTVVPLCHSLVIGEW